MIHCAVREELKTPPRMITSLSANANSIISPEQTPPDLTQATAYNRLTSQMEKLQTNIQGLSEEIKRLEQEEYSRNLQMAGERRVGSLQEW